MLVYREGRHSAETLRDPQGGGFRVLGSLCSAPVPGLLLRTLQVSVGRVLSCAVIEPATR
jgi:hypothetical protein